MGWRDPARRSGGFAGYIWQLYHLPFHQGCHQAQRLYRGTNGVVHLATRPQSVFGQLHGFHFRRRPAGGRVAQDVGIDAHGGQLLGCLCVGGAQGYLAPTRGRLDEGSERGGRGNQVHRRLAGRRAEAGRAGLRDLFANAPRAGNRRVHRGATGSV